MTDLAASFPDLQFDRPAPGVLRITLDAPGLNSVNPTVHRELADVWLDGRPRPGRRTSRCSSGAGKAFSAGGSFDLLESIVTRRRVRARASCGEARDLVFNVINCSKPIVSAIHGPAVGAGLVAGAARRRLGRRPHRAHHRRPHAPRRRRRRPRRDLLAAAVRHGEGEVLPADLRHAHRRGGRAHRARVAVRRRRRRAGPRARDRDAARRWRAAGDPLDEAHAQPLVPGASGDRSMLSLAYEFIGFAGADARGARLLRRSEPPSSGADGQPASCWITAALSTTRR